MAGEVERSNRCAANRSVMRGTPKAAQSACMERADDWLGVPQGHSVPVDVFDYGQGNHEITLASGHYRAKCSVNAPSQVADILSP